MLLDITDIGATLQVQPTEAPRAANVLSTQLGSLEYAPNLGIDMRYFLESEFRIQTSSFKAYCVQRLLEHSINVVNVHETAQAVLRKFQFDIGSSEQNEGFIA